MTITPDLYTNNGTSTVNGSLTATSATIPLPTGDGAKFPSTGPFMVQLGDPNGVNELCKCTSRSGDTLNVVRGSNLPAPDTCASQTWTFGTAVQLVVTAGNMANIWNYLQNPQVAPANLIGSGAVPSGWTLAWSQITSKPVFNVKDYGATGNGSTDDTTAILNAQAAAAAVGGGIVYFPPGIYRTSACIVLTSDNVVLMGDGWNSVIKPVSGATFDVISSPIPTSVGTAGYTRNYVGIYNLKLDCSAMNGTVAGQGNGIHFWGVRYSFIRKVYIYSCDNWAVLLDGDNVSGSSGNFGYDNSVSECVFDLCNAGVWQTNCEANRYTENQFKWAGAATLAPQPYFLNGTTAGSTTPGTDTTAMHLRLGAGYSYVAGNVFGKGGSYTTPAIRTENSGPCRIIGNRFDQVRYQAVVLNAGNHIFAFNQIGTPSSSGVTNAIQLGSSNNIVIGNQFDTTAGAAHHQWAVAESGGPFTGNIIVANHLIAGSSGIVLTTAGSTHVEWGNTGVHNEVKGDSIPAVATTSYQITDTDNLIYTDSTTAAFTVTLPNPKNGLFLTIKDKTGTAGTHNITINTAGGTATIDGAASGTVKITTNYGVLRLMCDGTNWFTV